MACIISPGVALAIQRSNVAVGFFEGAFGSDDLRRMGLFLFEDGGCKLFFKKLGVLFDLQSFSLELGNLGLELGLEVGDGGLPVVDEGSFAIQGGGEGVLVYGGGSKCGVCILELAGVGRNLGEKLGDFDAEGIGGGVEVSDAKLLGGASCAKGVEVSGQVLMDDVGDEELFFEVAELGGGRGRKAGGRGHWCEDGWGQVGALVLGRW